jgi:hypothetical protein
VIVTITSTGMLNSRCSVPLIRPCSRPAMNSISSVCAIPSMVTKPGLRDHSRPNTPQAYRRDVASSGYRSVSR